MAEMVKFAGTRFLEWDEQLEYEGIKPKANTSDLNEELGQVRLSHKWRHGSPGDVIGYDNGNEQAIKTMTFIESAIE